MDKVVTATRINALQDAVIALASGENVQFVDGMEKTSGFGYVSLRPVRSESSTVSSSSSSHPWAISVTTDDNGKEVVKLSPGTINMILPSDIFDSKPVLKGKTNYISLKVLTNGKSVTAVTWQILAAAPTPTSATEAVAPPLFTVPLGVILEGNVLQIESANLSFTPEVVMMVARRPAYSGDERFTRWWNWTR